MRLKTIKIFGFKSFPEQVTLTLEGGMIGLVGPNGCGKSNVVDAIRFAMGEQSTRALRAEKMDDLLFAGNAKRKSLSLAEVILTFENCDIPDFPMSEIAVGRRVYRDGHSEYLINGKVARLKEVERLFLGSGIGKNGFCLFEQGKLDDIIRLHPKERRAIFEETAGISRFVEREKEAAARLEELKGNFLRLSDQVEGKKGRIDELKKQADLARAFLEKKKKEEKLTRSLLLSIYGEMKAKEEEVEKKIAALTQEAEKLKASEKSLEEKIALEREREKKEREGCALIEKELQELESSIQVNAIEEKKAEEKRVSHLAFEKSVSDEKKGLEERLKELAIEIKEKEKRKEHFCDEKKKIEAKLKKINEEKAAFQGKEKEIEEAKSALFRSSSQVEKASYGLKEKRLHLELKEKREKALCQMIEEKKEEGESLKKSLEKRREEKKSYEEKIEEVKKELLELSKSLTDLAEEQKELACFLETSRHQEMEWLAKKRALETLSSQSASFTLLEEAKTEKSPLFGKVKALQDLLKRPHPFYQETLVVNSKKEAKELLALAKEKKLTDFSLFISEFLHEDLEEHFFKETVEVESTSDLFGKKKESFSPDGDFCDAKGVLFFLGKKRVTLEKEKKEIDEKIKQIRSEIKEKLALIEAKEKKKRLLDAKRAEMEELKRKSELRHFEINFHLSQQGQEIEKRREERATLEEELKVIGKEKEGASKEIKEAEKRFSSLEEEKRRSEESLKALEGRLLEKKAINEAFDQSKKEESALLLEEARNQERFSNLIREKKEMELLFQKKAEHLTSIAGEKERLEKEKKELALKKAELSKRREERREFFSKQKSVMAKRRERESLESVMVKEKRRLLSIGEEKNKLEKEKLILSYKKEQRGGEFSNRFSEEIEGALASFTPHSGNQEDWESEIKSLREELATSSNLNFSSIDELVLVEESFSFLEREYSDIKSAKEDVEKLIETLRKESRLRFQTTFTEIRIAFQKNFSLLFGGGKADLILTPAEDLLTAGVDIVVEPPGQKLRQIALLSGGERCLSALALLFSLFEIRPAPFCLMDEVDAPLDEANIGRFTNLLSQFISKTQFLIVTHNKRTMAMADLLVGVTMEEKGVSKILSLEFERELEEALT